ncbi:unnamed protein product [Bathycoccus prasinos]
MSEQPAAAGKVHNGYGSSTKSSTEIVVNHEIFADGGFEKSYSKMYNLSEKILEIFQNKFIDDQNACVQFCTVSRPYKAIISPHGAQFATFFATYPETLIIEVIPGFYNTRGFNNYIRHSIRNRWFLVHVGESAVIELSPGAPPAPVRLPGQNFLRKNFHPFSGLFQWTGPVGIMVKTVSWLLGL